MIKDRIKQIKQMAQETPNWEDEENDEVASTSAVDEGNKVLVYNSNLNTIIWTAEMSRWVVNWSMDKRAKSPFWDISNVMQEHSLLISIHKPVNSKFMDWTPISASKDYVTFLRSPPSTKQKGDMIHKSLNIASGYLEISELWWTISNCKLTFGEERVGQLRLLK